MATKEAKQCFIYMFTSLVEEIWLGHLDRTPVYKHAVFLRVALAYERVYLTIQYFSELKNLLGAGSLRDDKSE